MRYPNDDVLSIGNHNMLKNIVITENKADSDTLVKTPTNANKSRAAKRRSLPPSIFDKESIT